MTPEQFDTDTIKRAAMFVAFLQVTPNDRRRHEFLVDNRNPSQAYCEALGAANTLQVWANENAIPRQPLIYAVDAAGRQALVLPKDAQRLGLLP